MLLLMGGALALEAAPPDLVATGKDGKLIYDADARGNRVPDFSSCGYAGADREIPDAPVRVVVAPVPGDETDRIQRALDYVGSLPADAKGIRGAVLLLKGRHEVSGGLTLARSGVVLRGQGPGQNGTILAATGQDRRTLLQISGLKDLVPRKNPSWRIAEDYVPVGATRFRLQSVEGLKVGDAIRVVRPSTQAWIDRLGANDFGGGEGGGWKPGRYDIVWNRTIQSIGPGAASGKNSGPSAPGTFITLDAPITLAIETDLGGGWVEAVSQPGRLREVGVEHLGLESTFDAGKLKDENHCWFALTMENTADAWVRQVEFRHFAGSAVALYESCQRITVEDCRSFEPVSEEGGSRRNTFFSMGQQTLFLRCTSEQGRHDFAVGDCAAGPNAFVQCEASAPLGDSGAIQSVSSGTLFDGVRIDGNALSLGYRPGNMERIGWAAANSVLWNCSASILRCWNPPGAQNWAFGSWGGFEGDGVWRNSNGFMRPESLYSAQLAERNGRRVEILSRAARESSNPTLEEAAALMAASRRPAPQLADYIAAAGSRNPIPAEPGKALRIEDLPPKKPEPLPVKRRISLSNGWLVCEGRLLAGAGMETIWWRGSIRPAESSTYGPALTRFAPGSAGVGLTDDLAELIQTMERQGRVTFDQHYGLWYDRRRDDHERVRRMTGDVIAPFFEQPFARSGQGRAWDGLSQYDLTRFNPWYWSRLQQFAGLADESGRVLFNQNYFQHNIIEAGAHWVDCPWRTANNINGTGFPEPPPFAGDKRIFMAELFYDVTQPVRRKLHEGFIRQNLEAFKGNANVIQFTSAEFTGPLPFMEFWLETIAAWEKEQPNHQPLVALSGTKDVQDAILADPARAATVDLIDFRYWWRTDQGLFAPEGGKNLSPRQFERQWKGGRPNDRNLAGMAADYRARFPLKPVICDFDAAGWAWVCAGGSLPRLPGTTDPQLLAAIPGMRPWTEAARAGSWVLREAGRQYLVFGSTELDLTGETGEFRVRLIDPQTGTATPGGTVRAGAKVTLPDTTVVWLTRE